MATTVTTYKSSEWNLPENTSKELYNITSTKVIDTYDVGDWRTEVSETTNTKATQTIQSSTSESLVSTAYSYRTTGAKYSTTSLGEETVNVTSSAVNLIAQPYMKAGEKVKIIGKNFPVNSEIAIYLDNTLMTPVYENLVYNSNNLPMVSGQFSSSEDISMDRISSVKKPWVWSITKSTNGYWKLAHTPYNNQGIEYYYNNEVWYYKFANENISVIGDSRSLKTSDGKNYYSIEWCKYITRTAWIKDYINNNITDEILKAELNGINNTDLATGKTYKEEYTKEKIVLMSDNNGYFEVNIEIPKNTPTGNHIVTATTVTYPNMDVDYIKSATSSFTGEAYLRHWNTTVQKRMVEVVNETVYRDVTRTDTYQKYATVNDTTTVTTTSKNTSRTWNTDPVAQTFKVKTEQFLVGIDVYFSRLADSSTISPWIALREVDDNGVPKEEMLYCKEIDKNGVIVDADSLEEGKATKPTYIAFDYPIYVTPDKTYAFTLGADSDGYHVYYSQLGETDVTDGEQITFHGQQSIEGVMMISSNNSAWSPIQEADLKYTLYKAKFDTTNPTEFYIDKIGIKNKYDGNIDNKGIADIETKLTNFNTLNVSLSNIIYDDTAVDVYYSILPVGTSTDNLPKDSTIPWYKFNLEEMVTFNYNSSYENGMQLVLKIVLRTNNEDLSPVINLNTLQILLGKFKNYGEYVQNVIELS